MKQIASIFVIITLIFVKLSAQQHCFQAYSLNEGLPQSEVIKIIQTKLSTLWVGTNGGGIAEFDGKKFKNVNFPAGYVDKEILSIYKSQNGTVYIAGKNTLAVYDGLKIKNYIKEQGYINGINSGIVENPYNGDMLLFGRTDQCQSYLLKIKGDSLVPLENEFPEIKALTILHVFADTIDKVLYLTTQNGLYQFTDKPKLLRIKFKNFENYSFTLPMARFSDTIIYALLPENARSAVLLMKTSEKIEQIPTLSDPLIFAGLKKDKQGNYWFATREGLAHYNGETTKNISKINGLPVNNILSLESDNSGNIWIGTQGAGLLKFCGNEMVRYTENDGLKSNIVRHFAEFDNQIWIATEGGGISALDFDKNIILNHFNNINTAENQVHSIIEYKNSLYAGTRGGILELQNETFVNVNKKFGLNANISAPSLLAQGDTLWIITNLGGIHYHHGGKLHHFTKQNGLKSNLVNSVFADSQSRVWICSPNGINYILKDSIYSVSAENENYDINAIQITEDRNHHIWITSFSQGLFQYNEKGKIIPIENVSQSNEFLSYSIKIDHENKLWLGRQQGIFKYSISGKQIKQERVWMGNNSNLECNGNAVFIDSKNRHWFGTIYGAVAISGVEEHLTTSKPTVHISEMKLFLKDIDWHTEPYKNYYSNIIPWIQLPETPKLPFNLNYISFTLNATDFNHPNDLKFSWFLEGLEQQWSPITTQNIISFNSLAPGKYTFKAKAVNNQNNWSDEISYSFEIVEPLWKSTIFRLILIFSLILIITIFVVLRLRGLKRNKEDLELLIRLKTKEIMQQNAEILTQNKILERQKQRISKTVERLKESYSDLALLNEIGKDISYSLSIQTIIDKVYENINTLLDASIFGIGIYKKDILSLEFISAKEKGKVLPTIQLSIKETEKLAVKCLLDNEEIFINDFETDYLKYGDSPTKLVTQQIPSSLFYVPLTIADRKIGIITVQSYKKYAYDDYHLNLIRNIAIYTGIALVNAETYEQLQDKTENLETANNFIKEKNKQIEKQNEELKNLNEEKNKLIRIVAHDLRNPLTAGLTSIEILNKTEKGISENGIKQFDYLKSALWRMNEMIGKILDVKAIEEKKQNITIEPVQATPLLIDLIHQYQKRAESKKIEFEFIPLRQKQYIYADTAFLSQVFDNLISNALKFSPAKTTITIREEIIDESLRISIKDQGQGFTADELKELFKNFRIFSAQPTGNEASSGLGLSIVKKYIDDMDGKIWCESEAGKGANFIIEFELVENFSH